MRTITSASLLAMIAPAFLNGAKPLSAALQKVQSTYVRTVMDSRTGKVVELGSILVLQIDGVMANPMRSSSGPYWNVSTGGQIGPDNGFAASSLNAAATNTRSLAVGEKVYIYGLSIGANSIAFRVQSCGTCDPKAVDLANQPYREFSARVRRSETVALRHPVMPVADGFSG